jgi:NADH dehydrogenase
MILITDPTCIVGRELVRRLCIEGAEISCLLQPAPGIQRLPQGARFKTFAGRLSDPDAVEAALEGVDTVIHLVGEGSLPPGVSMEDHPDETASLVEGMKATGVTRIVYLSRIGADQSSAYRLFRDRARAEQLIRESGLRYTILRTSVVYGEEDRFTNLVVMLAKMMPLFLPIPDPGMSRFQPLWIGDLVTCVLAALPPHVLAHETISIGGSEHLTLEQLVTHVLDAADMRRTYIKLRMPWFQALNQLAGSFLARPLLADWQVDIIRLGSVAELAAIPRHFGFEPVRFADALDYLGRPRPWRRDFLRHLLGAPAGQISRDGI